MNPDEIAQVNRTSRGAGAVGSRALVPKLVRTILHPEDKILDYGAGKTAMHAKSLQDEGYDVTPYDIGINVIEGLHDPNALEDIYDVVYASNVLNVVPHAEALTDIVSDIYSVLPEGGRAVVNYPESPRYSDLTTEEVVFILEEFFSSVEKIGGSKRAPVWLVIK